METTLAVPADDHRYPTKIMRFRQISLLGLLSIAACVAIAISHVITSLRLSRANAELAGLRQRLELIQVDDTTQIAVRRLPSSDEHVRRWAIRVPGGESRVLAANWGASPLADVQDIEAKSVRTFKLDLDPATNEEMVLFRVQRNENDPAWGILKFHIGGNHSTIAISPEITALLMGETPARSEAVGDKPVARSLNSSITLYGIEATGTEKSSFCLWLAQLPPPDGG